MSLALDNARFARALLSALASGVRDVITSPGSRNTPLVLAALEVGLRCHTVLDERVAGFAALGLARASGRPVALLCTSGSAGAHYLPAVIEAEASRIPLVVLTADRPPELWGCGAPQTIDQLGLFGSHVRRFELLGPHEGFDAAWPVAVAGRALRAAAGPPRGPVHLDVAFREPLWAPGLPPLSGQLPAPARVVHTTGREALDLPRSLLTELRGARGVIVCGPDSADPPEGHAFAEAVTALALQLGWPVLAEPSSQVRFGTHDRSHVVAAADPLLRDPELAALLRPEVALCFGRVATSKVTAAWLSQVPCRVLVDSAGEARDPFHSTAAVVAAEPVAACRALSRALGAREPGPWLRRWRTCEAAAQLALERACAPDEPRARSCWEGAIARRVAAALPAGALLQVASSMPVRDLDAFAAPRAAPLAVVANRGANGIDGTLASALGAGLAEPERPLTVLTGDLSFLHDAGGLLAARGLGLQNATVVVVNNAGGGIFERLPIASHPDRALFERRFVTPPQVELPALCAAAGFAHQAVSDLDTLGRRLASPEGLSVLEVPTSRADDLARHTLAFAAAGRAAREEVACPSR